MDAKQYQDEKVIRIEFLSVGRGIIDETDKKLDEALKLSSIGRLIDYKNTGFERDGAYNEAVMVRVRVGKGEYDLDEVVDELVNIILDVLGVMNARLSVSVLDIKSGIIKGEICKGE